MNISKFSDIKIKKLLFKGGSGSVYKVLINEKPFAVKKIKNIIYNENEYKITCFNNKKLLKCFYKLEEKKYTYLFFDYYKNGDLFEYLVRKGSINEKQTINYVFQMLNCLKELNNLGFNHLDLKLENFLLNDNKNLILCDFGSVKKINENNNVLSTSSSIVGTKSYNSPEVYLGCYSNKSDLWSIGVSMYIMLKGKKIYNDPSEIFDIDFSVNYNNISPESKDLLENLLQIKPKDRYSIDCALNHKIFNDQYIIVF